MNPFEYTDSIALELSNVCSHAWLHERCPLHEGMAEPGVIRDPQTLPASIVESVLTTLGENRYAAALAFHQYNEPLQDPRLFLFLARAKKLCPEAQIYVVTNGYNLTPTLAQELIDYGVQKILISLVGTETAQVTMRKRAEVLTQQLGVERIAYNPDHIMDDRLLIYDVPKPNQEQPCRAPLGQVIIRHDGKVGLCCYDWRGRYSFGDLREQPLDEILCSEEIRAADEELLKGYRTRALCRQCGRSR